MTIQAFAAKEAGARLERFEYDPGELGWDEVEIDVKWCGLCHSDLSMWENGWGMSEYPLVPGHEVVGTVAAVGERVEGLEVGAMVGLGWNARSCGRCRPCLGGKQNLCVESVGTIVGRHGGFADKVRAQATWAVPLPSGVDASLAGPLFCGGVTVFSPLLVSGVRPTDRVGVVGIGGLGHLAVQFAAKWGCEVTALSTTADKEEEARELGAHEFVNVKEEGALGKLEGKFDLILCTVNAALPWDAYVAALAPEGKLHLVGAAPEVCCAVFPLIVGERSVGGSPIGSPGTMATMLDFCGRHGIEPMVERMPMGEVNEAFRRLKEGSPRYRIVLENPASE